MSVDYTEMDIIGLEMQDNAKKKKYLLINNHKLSDEK